MKTFGIPKGLKLYSIILSASKGGVRILNFVGGGGGGADREKLPHSRVNMKTSRSVTNSRAPETFEFFVCLRECRNGWVTCSFGHQVFRSIRLMECLKLSSIPEPIMQ